MNLRHRSYGHSIYNGYDSRIGYDTARTKADVAAKTETKKPASDAPRAVPSNPTADAYCKVIAAANALRDAIRAAEECIQQEARDQTRSLEDCAVLRDAVTVTARTLSGLN